MANYFKILCILYICLAGNAYSQCINTSAYGQATVTSCSSGTITTCNWGGEYSELNIQITGNFTFNSSIATDYFTLTDASNNVITFGNAPLTASITTPGLYRLHVSASSACGTNNVCRVTSYSCAGGSGGGNNPCINTSAYGQATVTSCSSGTITTCNWGGEYSELNFQTTGNFTFYSSISSDYLTFTTASNVVIAAGPQPLAVNIPSAGLYRLHVSANSSCATDNTCRVTSYGCINTPCSGTPVAGNAVASSTTSCAGQQIYFSLSGTTSASGLSYQWQSSPNGSTWSNIPFQTAPGFSQSVTSSTYFRCIVACGTYTAASGSAYVVTSSPLSYATVPYYETFDNVWQNGCATRNVPNNQHWTGNPLSGDNAWRRQDDGISASWNAPASGISSPASGVGYANFHSSMAGQHAKGELDFMVNMTQNAKYALSFYYLNPGGTDNLEVLLSTDAGTSFSIKGNYTTQAAWTKKTIYFNAVSSPSCIVRFRGYSDNGADDLGIDSMSIRMVCVNPTVTAVSTTTSICAGQTLTLTASGASSYTWTPGNITSPVAVVSPTVNTHYVVTATNDGLCFPTAAVSVSVTTCSGIEAYNTGQTEVSVFPNPVNDLLKVLVSGSHGIFTFELHDIYGRLVLKETLPEGGAVVPVQMLTPGVYIYKVIASDKHASTGRVLKQ
ncbi:MAG: T9SS type A sorting domain-containing protein [Bacteroidetes bacterium]|nr:T9SS type A sorting domain-containing protein [Bacteroidota bacterium]